METLQPSSPPPLKQYTRFCSQIKHTSDLPYLNLHKIPGAKLPIDKKATISFTQASPHKLRSFLFLPDQDRCAAKRAHWRAFLESKKSKLQAGISGGGPSTMRFPLLYFVLTSGTLPHLQSALTAMPLERIYYTIFFSARQRKMHGLRFCTNA